MRNTTDSIPDGWMVAPLGEIAEFQAGRTPSRAKAAYWADGSDGVPWVSIGDMKLYETLTATAERITPLALKETFGGRMSKRGTLLMSFKLTIGRVATLGVDACHNEAIVSIYPKGINQQFLAFFLSQVDYRDYQDRAIKGNTLNRDKIARIQTLLPPPQEQEKIAALLLMIRESLAIEERIVQTTRELKHAAMAKVFSEGLRGEVCKDSEVGPIPATWEVRQIKDEARLVAGGTPRRDEPSFWTGGVIPWVKTGEIDYGVIEDTEERITPAGLEHSSAQLLPAGTLLLAMYGQGVTRGKVALLGLEAATNQACVAIIPKSPNLSQGFLYYYLTFSYEKLRSLSHGAQQQNLSSGLVGAFPFPLPTVTEQEQVVGLLRAIDDALTVHLRRRATLERLFQAMLDGLMTGKLRVDKLQIDTTALVAA